MVIPGRNTEKTLAACLEAVVPYLASGGLREIVFIDDGSTDGTLGVAAQYPVRVLEAGGVGPGGARNLGWRAVDTDLVWFIDADCVAKDGALEALQRELTDPSVGGAGGTYANEVPGSLLATLIHSEIVERHRRMPVRVGYLATYNVLYRRAVLDTLRGFDEGRFNAAGKPGAEDIDFAYRAAAAGWELRFVRDSVVGHHHPTDLGSYLRTQRNHGFWRVALHLDHRRQGAGDDYSGLVDHAQPVVAMLALGATPLLFVSRLALIPLALWGLLGLLQLPMTVRLVRWQGSPRYLAYIGLGVVRAVWRGFGMTGAIFRRFRAVVR